jgi:hypothetical protein
MKSVLGMATFLLLAQSLCYAQPAADFTEVDHDFSIVINENKAEHVFEVSNGGDEDLLIEELVGSSGTITAVAKSESPETWKKGKHQGNSRSTGETGHLLEDYGRLHK